MPCFQPLTYRWPGLPQAGLGTASPLPLGILHYTEGFSGGEDAPCGEGARGRQVGCLLCTEG